MDETIRQANCELQTENQKLQSLNTSLHKKYHTMSLKVKFFVILCACMYLLNIVKHFIVYHFLLKLAGLQDNVNCKETEVAEMRNQIEELQYEYQKISDRNYKLETHLSESRDKLKGLEAMQIDDKIIPKQESSITQSSLSLQKV